jgi:succinate-semialdehyde dehydrogenase / glutarate-semialdehyde dehydrogenase
MESINPATGEHIATYDPMTDRQVEQIIDAVHRRFGEWKKTDFEHRAGLMRRCGDLLRERAEELGDLMTREMGKVRSEAQGEVKKCAWVCDYYADHAESFLADESIETEVSRSFVTYQPIGVVLAVMPWNFPLWQVFRFVAPALMAGNVGVLKHASNVCGCALAIEKVVADAGFPEDVFRTLLIPSKQVERVIRNPLVRAVTLTGSVPAGSAVASLAGEELKKTVLELGGSDPYIILDDADLKLAAQKCAQSRLLNAGQSCIAAKRFIVVEKVHDAFVEAFVSEMKARKMGDPTKEGIDLGPQASVELRNELHDQVRRSVEQGANCVLGGEVPDGAGAYYPPTVLTGVEPGMAAYSEELFGPVASVIKVADTAEAVKVANDSEFGLGGAVFTKDVDKGLRLAAKEIDTGFCAVNDFVKSDPRLPFGGVKKSGYGRELSYLGIREFVNIKTVTAP